MGLDKAIMKVGGALGVIGGIQCVVSPLLSPHARPASPARAGARRLGVRVLVRSCYEVNVLR